MDIYRHTHPFHLKTKGIRHFFGIITLISVVVLVPVIMADEYIRKSTTHDLYNIWGGFWAFILLIAFVSLVVWLLLNIPEFFSRHKIKRGLGFVSLGIFAIAFGITFLLIKADRTGGIVAIVTITSIVTFFSTMFLLGNRLLKIIAGVILVLFLIFIITYLFFVQPRKISGNLMSPDYKNGEFYLLDLQKYKFSDPERGDVIIYKKEYRHTISRIIGLPGDTIVIDKKSLTVNGQILHEPYATWIGRENMPLITVKVDPGRYYVMFDTRSFDPSYETIERDSILGKVWIRYWPSIRIAPQY